MSCVPRLLLPMVAMQLLFTLAPPHAHGQDTDAGKTSAQSREEYEKDFEKGEKGDEGSYIRKRQEWFHHQRAYPLKNIPAGVRQRAIKQRNAKLAVEAASRARVAGSPAAVSQPQWTLIGPQPVDNYYGVSAGRVTAVAVDPGNPKIVYAGGAEGGLWKTTDGGVNWTPRTDNQVSLAVGSIAIDPNNSSIIYVGTGEENFSGDSYYGSGILKSTNGGSTWTQVCGPFCGPIGSDSYYGGGAYIGQISVEPGNSKVVLAAVEYYGYDGIYRSADGGATWSLVLAGNGSGTAAFFNPANGSVAYAATIQGGVFKSADAGLTWTASNGGGIKALPSPNGGRVALAVAPSSPMVLYAGIENPADGSLLGFYKSTDGGASWTQLVNTPQYCSYQCWYDDTIGISPVDPNFVIVGGSWAYSTGNSAALRSLDGGNTWTDFSSGIHPDAHAMAFSSDGSILYTGNDGGVWSTNTPTAATIDWTSLNPTLALTEFYPGVSLDPGNVNHTYIGSQDNGTNKYSGALAWPTVDCGDGGATAIDFAHPNVVYTGCITATLDKSLDDGATFNAATNGINTDDRVAWVPPLAMDPENSQTLYFGTYLVYQTTNAAGVWTPISPDLTAGGYLSTLAVAPTDSNTIYSGSDDSQVFVTRNALSGTGATWSNVTSATALPPRSIDWIAVDPTTPTTAYVVYSGFSGFGDNLGHVFKTTDAGSTWTDISSDLPNTPVDSILVDPDSPETLFIGTDIGAFYTTSGGASWSTLGTGLPNVVVTGLALHNASRTLRASTHGRSVWDLNIATLLPVPSITSLSPASVSAGSAEFSLTVNGVQFNSGSIVQWNGAPLATTFVNAGQLTAIVHSRNLTAAGTAAITVFNANSGKLSNAATFTINNVVPGLASVAPNSVTVGGSAFTLTANGSGFVNGATVLWNGSPRTTSFASATQVTAAILASDIATATPASVSVANPAPGGGPSSALTVTVVNPPPAASSLSPTSATAGQAAFTLTVNGSAFVSGATVHWNGAPLTTAFVGATRLHATVPASDVQSAGTPSVTVVNPAPGGGTSGPLAFTIDNPAPYENSLAPTSVVAGSPHFTLTIAGGRFVPTSQVNWNGAPLATTYVSSTKVTALVHSSAIVSPGTASITVVNPAPGGGTSNTLDFTVENPVPKITATAPATPIAGGPAFTLTVTGTNFVSKSKIHWNGTPIATTSISPTQISASIDGSYIHAAGTASITVANPAPGGGTSPAFTITIEDPVPSLTKIGPTSAVAGGAAFTLTLQGSNFVSASTVLWNGKPLATPFLSSTQIEATVPASDLQAAGTASVTVANPAPGGGTSSAATFTITGPPASK